MQFGNPEFLYTLIIIPVMAVFLIFAFRRRQKDIAKLGDPRLLNRLSESINRKGRMWQLLLWFLALELLLLGLARPQWGTEVQRLEQEGIEIMLALDISRSMLAEDLKPDRLTRAKLEIVDLMTQLEGNEIGLVLFSGASFIQFPLTSDFATARTFLDSARPGIISRPGTDIGSAIETAMSGFNSQRASAKVIIIFTDGENLSGDAILAARQAAEQDVTIYTIGFGSPQGEPIPEYNDQGVLLGYVRDDDGQTVISKLDESTLTQIALAANGQYYRASASGEELSRLVRNLQQLQTARLDSRFETLRVERFQWFVGAGLLALFVIELIPDRKRRLRN